ncbi:putative methylesterase 14 [Hibiscus syriacus]|uniref:Methylesterase 14 n=1 Tax=Hibiscus syriacus TaxID=106335 RepID=A0A6A2WRR6_HIBSY|nr:putative methylesterase 14 [Hibiscus syriacus]
MSSRLPGDLLSDAFGFAPRSSDYASCMLFVIPTIPGWVSPEIPVAVSCDCLASSLCDACDKYVVESLENIKFKRVVLIHGKYTNTVTTLEEYSKPLIQFLETLPEDEKIILVGYSSGGACLSYALENLPEKISKAIFLCATIVSNGQRPFDVFSEELGSGESFRQESRFLIYGNRKDKPPTGFMFTKQLMKGLYFNQSPTKHVALAMVSMRLTLLGPIMERLPLSPDK